MTAPDDPRYARMAKAITALAENWEAAPDLAHAARESGLSPWHFQREFTRWVGISPKRFQGHLALAHAKRSLRRDLPVLESALAAGLSGPSRLHDLAVNFDAASPGEIRSRGRGLALRYGAAETPFGRIFIVSSDRGLVRLAFIEPGAAAEAEALAREREAWPQARFAADTVIAGDIAGRVFRQPADRTGGIRLAPRGTNFQIKVWQALLALPPGAVATYAAIARAIGAPKAARAVGGACAANPIAVLIPCHRVLKESGAVGGYAFGPARKRALLAWEAAAWPPPRAMMDPVQARTGAGEADQSEKPRTSAME